MIEKNSERPEQFLGNIMVFLTSSWRFLIAKELEQSEFILEKIIGIWKHAGIFRKCDFLSGIETTQCRPIFFSETDMSKHT